MSDWKPTPDVNAREEFIEHVAGMTVKCARVESWLTDDVMGINKQTIHKLKVGYTEAQYAAFLDSLNFMYYSGHGPMQHIYGTIWYADCTWSVRGEYDNSEWWEQCSMPAIPGELK